MSAAQKRHKSLKVQKKFMRARKSFHEFLGNQKFESEKFNAVIFIQNEHELHDAEEKSRHLLLSSCHDKRLKFQSVSHDFSHFFSAVVLTFKRIHVLLNQTSRCDIMRYYGTHFD